MRIRARVLSRTALLTTVALAAVATLGGGVLAAGAANADTVYVQAPQQVGGGGLDDGYGVGWSAPEAQLGLTGYVVDLYSVAGGRLGSVLQSVTVGVNEDTDGVGDYQYEFAGLTPGVEYAASVSADYGTYGESQAVTTGADQAYAPFGKVQGVRVRAGSHQLSVSWDAIAQTSLTGQAFYAVGISPQPSCDSPSATLSCGGSLSPFTSAVITGLTNGVTYTVSVAAIGGSAFSFDGSLTPGAATVRSTPVGLPASPTHLVVAWKRDGRTALSWAAARSSKAAPVDGYVVYVNGREVKTLRGRDARHWTVGGERAHHSYTFTVRAYNGSGRSAPRFQTFRRPVV